jgi:hypothetical protein
VDGKPLLLVMLPVQTVLKMPVMELFLLGASVKVLLLMGPCKNRSMISDTMGQVLQYMCSTVYPPINGGGRSRS